jgi:hypothetical protein
VLLPGSSRVRVFRHPPQQDVPSRNALPENHTEGFLNFFSVHVPPLQAALWQSRSEPVKVLPLRSGRRGGACGDL